MSDELAAPPVAEAGTEGEAAEQGGRRHIGMAALAIAAIHLLAKIGGYIQKRFLSQFIGTTMAGDACVGMEKIFQLIFFIPEELLSHSLLPVFSRTRARDGEAAAWRLASLTGTLQALILIVTTIAAMVWAPALVHLVLEGFTKNQEKFELTVRLVRYSMLGLFCTSIGSLTYVLLNAYKRFVTPALGDITQKIGIVAGLVVVFYGFSELGPLGYAIGFILGGIFKLVTHLLALGSKLKLVRPGFDFKSPGLRELGWLMVPLLAGTIVAKIRDGWEQRLASQAAVVVTGTVAALDYAKKIALMPVLVVPYAFSKAVFPFFADWASNDDRPRLTQSFHECCRLMVFLFLPLSVAFIILQRELVTLAYKGGKFDDQSVLLTAAPFVIYSLGLVFYALEMIAIQVFYAYRDAKTPFYLGLIASALQISIAWAAGLALGFGGAGIALGYAVAKALKLVLMWWQLRHRLTGFEFRTHLVLLAKTIVASAVMGAWLYAGHLAAPRFLDLTSVKLAALYLATTCAVGGGLFFATAALLRTTELNRVAAMVRKRLKRGKA